MKKSNLLRQAGAKPIARFGLRQQAFAFLFLATFGLSGCFERSCEDPEPTEQCNTFATVEEDACHDGALGNKWLRLDNGELLWPQNISVPVPTLQHGQRVQIGYATLQANPGFTGTCNYITAPEQPDLAILLTCIQPIFFCGTGNGSETCTTFATAQPAMCGTGAWGSTWLKLDDGTWLQPFENAVAGASLEEGQRYKIGYEKMARDNRYDGQVTCLAVPPAADAVRITCISAEGSDVTNFE